MTYVIYSNIEAKITKLRVCRNLLFFELGGPLSLFYYLHTFFDSFKASRWDFIR